MNRIWIISISALTMLSLAFVYWAIRLGIFEYPNNKWLLPIAVAFSVPTIVLLITWGRSVYLNNLIGKEYPGRAEKHFKRFTEILCRRWNGEATINLISLQLVSSYDLRRELMKRENYVELIKNLLKANRFNFAESRHSHMECIDSVRQVITETEINHFKRRVSDILQKIDSVFFDSASAFLMTELPTTLCILGYTNSAELKHETMRIFDRLNPVQQDKLLAKVEKETKINNLPTTGRGENVRTSFPSLIRSLREKLAEKYIEVPA